MTRLLKLLVLAATVQHLLDRDTLEKVSDQARLWINDEACSKNFRFVDSSSIRKY